MRRGSAMRGLRRLPLLALLCAACGYQPRLFGGGDPADLGGPSSYRFSVIYHASCDSTCEVRFTREADVGVAQASGSWRERVSIRQGKRGSVTLEVRPLDSSVRIREAGIEVDGRRAAHAEPVTGAPVAITAGLHPRR
jgi:hypothetical protein